MKNKTFNWLLVIFSLAIVSVVSYSCNKQFDSPPITQEPSVTVTNTVADLKAMHQVPGAFEQITTDMVIGGVVVADDKSGNFYKEIVLQDATGGITIRLDGTGLYTNYPVGRKIYIKMKNLYLGDYNGRIQIGADVDKSNPARPSLLALPSALFDKYILKGSTGNEVVATVVSPSDLTTAMNNRYQNMLIKLNNFEFLAADTAKTYGDPVNHVTTKGIFNISNCANEKLELFNSAYSNFAGFSVPNGNGSITAVYVVFGTTKELIIRDTADVQFNGTRCSGAVTPPPTGNGTPISIDQLRQMYTGSGIKLGSYQVNGVVISDAASKNISNGAVIIQQGSKAVTVYFGGTITYSVGDSLQLDVTGDSLIKYQGGLEIKKALNAVKPAPLATGKTVAPNVLTIAALNTAMSAPNLSNSIEGTLVKINNASVTPAGTFSGSKTLSDGSGTILMFTSSTSTFSGATLPGGAKSWTGIATLFNTTNEIKLRNLNDVQ